MKGSLYGTVGIQVTYETRDVQFESSRGQFLFTFYGSEKLQTRIWEAGSIKKCRHQFFKKQK